MNWIVRSALVVPWLAMAACGSTSRQAMPDVPTGKRLFGHYCASCHGDAGRGDGPVSPLLKVAVPDVTRIAARRGGRFPDDEIFRIVDGQAPLPAHGTRNMPVWGYEFFGDDGDDAAAHGAATERIERLVRYLRSIQREP
ncbi:MAG TPA: cytochrome c [Steroidobacteraceae bacterium]|nr:cytochrome c [Steroidobacteraceae bacterium]